MAKWLNALLLPLCLAACSSAPAPQPTPSPCAVHEASYACQVERYQSVNAP